LHSFNLLERGVPQNRKPRCPVSSHRQQDAFNLCRMDRIRYTWHIAATHLRYTCSSSRFSSYITTFLQLVQLKPSSVIVLNRSRISVYLWNMKIHVFTKSATPYASSVQVTCSHSFHLVISTLTSHLCLGLPSSLLPSGFLTKTWYEFLTFSCAVHTCPFHPP